MSITIKGVDYDTMREACDRLSISRSSMLRYLKEGFFTPALEAKQGRGKVIRYFTADWYEVNEPRIMNARNGNGADLKEAV